MNTTSPHVAWAHVLDQLEADLARARDSAPDSSALVDTLEWTPPSDMPPMPPSVAERATTLHRRQLEVAAQLTSRMRETRRQTGYADQVDRATRDQATPLYVDTRA